MMYDFELDVPMPSLRHGARRMGRITGGRLKDDRNTHSPEDRLVESRSTNTTGNTAQARITPIAETVESTQRGCPEGGEATPRQADASVCNTDRLLATPSVLADSGATTVVYESDDTEGGTTTREGGTPKTISLRADEVLVGKLDAVATRLGATRTAAMRLGIELAYRAKLDRLSPSESRLLAELASAVNRLGVNVNQIARRVNSGGAVGTGELGLVAGEICLYIQDMQELVDELEHRVEQLPVGYGVDDWKGAAA